MFKKENFRPLADIHVAYNASQQNAITEDGLFNSFFLQFVEGVPNMLKTEVDQIICLFEMTAADCPELIQLYDKLKQYELPWYSYTVGSYNIAQYQLNDLPFVVGSDQETGKMFHLFVKESNFSQFNQAAQDFMEAQDLKPQEESYYTPGEQEQPQMVYAAPPATDENLAKMIELVAQAHQLSKDYKTDQANELLSSAIPLCSHDSTKLDLLYDLMDDNEELREDDIAEVYDQRGQRLASLGLYNQAIEDYSLALRMGYTHEHVYFNRGNAYSEIKNYDKAVEDFSKSMEINPVGAWNYNSRATCYNLLKKPELAVADYQEGLKHSPNEAALYNNLAMTLFDLGRLDEAIAHYRKTIELVPDALHIQINLAEAYICASRYEEALQTLLPQGVLIQSPHFPLVAETLRLILACIYNTPTQLLVDALVDGQQQGLQTGWKFNNIERWLAQANDLSDNTKAQIQEYLNIALSMSVTD